MYFLPAEKARVTPGLFRFFFFSLDLVRLLPYLTSSIPRPFSISVICPSTICMSWKRLENCLKKGLITKQEILDLAKCLKKKMSQPRWLSPFIFSALFHFQDHFRPLKMSPRRTDPLTAESRTPRSHYRPRSSPQTSIVY